MILKNEKYMSIYNNIENCDNDFNFISKENSDDDDKIEYENYVIKDKNKSLKAFFYYINLISKTKNISKNNKEEIINEIKNTFNSNLSIPNNNILVTLNNGSKISFTDNLVITQIFYKLSLQSIKNSYPNLIELYEFK